MSATPFTRTAGAMGVAALPLGLVLVVAMRAAAVRANPFERWRPGPLVIALLVAVVVCYLVALVGLVVRHAGEWWVQPVLALFGLAVVLALMDSRSDVNDGVQAATVILLGYGVAQAGQLPRHAAIALAAGSALELLFRHDRSFLVVAWLVATYGLTRLSWAMWREVPATRVETPALG